MRSSLLFAAAGLRRHKGAALTLGLMALIAALVLNLGLLSLTSFSSFVQSKVDELRTPYLTVVLSDQIGVEKTAEVNRLVTRFSGVTETQTEKVRYLQVASFPLSDSSKYTAAVILEQTDESGALGPFRLTGESGPLSDRSIYVPYILKAKNYKLGDSLALTYMGKTTTFTIAGFTEDVLLGSLSTGGIRFFLPKAAYEKLGESLGTPEVAAHMLSARTDSANNASALNEAVAKWVDTAKISRGSAFSIDVITFAVSIPVEIGAALEVGFALIVTLVMLLVVRFRVVGSIEQELQNIGALQAVGYTVRQVRAGLMLQFLASALLGGISGVALSYMVAGPYSQMLAMETGINWKQPFDMPVNLLTLLVLAGCVLLTAFVATGRLSRLPVIAALRGGLATHSFRQNRFPLERSRGPLTLLLALKSGLASMRQNIALAIILVFVSFAAVFCFLLYYNFAVDNQLVQRTLGDETADILVVPSSAESTLALLTELPQMAGVTQAAANGSSLLSADGQSGYGRVTADYAKLHNNQCYAGRYPAHDNEVALGGLLSAQLKKGIGDTVTLTMGEERGQYLITGLVQNMNTLGKGIYLTDAGMHRISPGYEPMAIYVYMDKGSSVETSIQKITDKFGAGVAAIVNYRDMLKGNLETYTAVVAIFAGAMFAVMALIVALILVMLTGETLVRRRRELGILKALGYTTNQLMGQLVAGYLPVAVLGTLLGGVLGWLEVNGLTSLLFRGMGIMKVQFYLPPLAVPIICAGIVLLTLLITLVASSRVRKLSPCVLVGE